MEVELKFALTSRQKLEIAEYLESIGRYCGRKQMSSLYFDIAGDVFKNSHTTLRLRREDEHIVLNIKHDKGSSSGLYRRSEWEFVVTELVADFDNFFQQKHTLISTWQHISHYLAKQISSAESSIEDLSLLKAICEQIIPEQIHLQCGARFARDIYSVEKDKDIVEVVIDEGDLMGREYTEAFMECELEIKQGNLLTLQQLGDDLSQKFTLRPQELSKFARAERLR